MFEVCDPMVYSTIFYKEINNNRGNTLNETPDKVFISYSWSSPEHKDWVMDSPSRSDIARGLIFKS